ncbi:MAG: hypothetical protein ABSB94_11580 [Syntrophorhabdales bacterium]
MSEYQYYEFQAVDRPLTRQQMSELRGYSTRAEITPTRFVNSYNWGSFKGNAEQWMERYFDAHLYFANWGTRILMLRIPERLLDKEVLEEYCADETGLSFHLAAGSFILSFTSEVEDHDPSQDEGALSSILPVRSGLMRGDHRALYLGWLLAVQSGEVDDETPEPRLPSGLRHLDASLEALADFLRIDRDLLWVRQRKGSPTGVRKAFPGRRSGRGCEVFRPRRRTRTSHALSKERILTSRLSFSSVLQGRGNACLRRTAGQIRARAEIIAEARKREEAERRAREKARHEREAAEKRLKYLQSLAGRESDLWAKADGLIATRQPGPYDEAVSLTGFERSCRYGWNGRRFPRSHGRPPQ